MHRAQQAEVQLADEANELEARLHHAQEEEARARERIVELRQNLRQCKQQYGELWGNWTALVEQWEVLRTQYNRLKAEAAARNRPTTAQGTQTISNEYRVGARI